MNNIQPASNLIPKPRQTNNTQKREGYGKEKYYLEQIQPTKQERILIGI